MRRLTIEAKPCGFDARTEAASSWKRLSGSGGGSEPCNHVETCDFVALLTIRTDLLRRTSP